MPSIRDGHKKNGLCERVEHLETKRVNTERLKAQEKWVIGLRWLQAAGGKKYQS